MTKIQSATEFLEELDSENSPVLLHTPDGMAGKAVALSDVEAYIEKHKDNNIYFAFNVGNPNGKSKEGEISLVRGIHVDIDPDPSLARDEAKRAIIERLRAYDKAPSIIIDSGNGYQAFWLFHAPLEVGNDVSLSKIRSCNRGVAKELGADSCWNLDRVMRLPFTTNNPNKAKQEKGAIKCPTLLLEFNDLRYNLEEFNYIEIVESTDKTPAKKLANQKCLSLDEISEKYPDIADNHLEVIRTGVDSTYKGDKVGDQSAYLQRCVNHLTALGMPDEEIKAILLNQDYGISKHIYEKSTSRGFEGQAEHFIDYSHKQREARARGVFADAPLAVFDPLARDRPDPVNEVSKVEIQESKAMAEMNKKYAFIQHHGKDSTIVVFRNGVFAGYQRVNSFLHSEGNKNIETFKKTPGGKTKIVQEKAGIHWLNSPHRRTYFGVDFNPTGEVEPDFLNLWTGFAIEPKEGDCSLMMEMIKKSLCDDNEDNFKYTLDWLAASVQRPGRPGGCALVVQGGRGIGKSTVGRLMKKIFGKCYTEMSTTKRLFDNFNNIFEQTVFLNVNEAFWAPGHAKYEGDLKAMITDSDIIVEEKNVDKRTVRNCLHIYVTSNEDHIIPVASEERRYFMLKASNWLVDMRKNDTKAYVKYFVDLNDEMDNGGAEAFLHFLLERDLSKYVEWTPPETDALNEQRSYGMTHIEQFWLDVLDRGSFFVDDEQGWRSEVSWQEIKEAWIEWVKDHGNVHDRASDRKLIPALRKIIPQIPQQGTTIRNKLYIPRAVKKDKARLELINEANFRKSRKCYTMLPLDEMRKQWNASFPDTFDEGFFESKSTSTMDILQNNFTHKDKNNGK